MRYPEFRKLPYSSYDPLGTARRGCGPGAMPVLSSAFESGVALVPHSGGFKGTPIDPLKEPL